jgi:hypothetical protein
LLIAAVMFNEQMTGRNILAVFGGVPERTAMREGYLRAQGPFTVYLTAGAFGATILPLFLCLWRRGGSRLMAVLGIVAALTITITSRTSTAMSACVAAFIGIAMWPLREKMRLVRWSIVVTLVGLHLVMKAPVWSLIARVDIVGGSTGWHRFKIVDNFIRHFWDWWLMGSNNYWTSSSCQPLSIASSFLAKPGRPRERMLGGHGSYGFWERRFLPIWLPSWGSLITIRHPFIGTLCLP